MATGGVLPLIISGLILFALSQRKPATSPGTPGALVEDAGLQLKVVRVFQDVLGLMRPGWSRRPISMGQALVLEEGASYQVQVTVTNGATRAGMPVAASFVVKLDSIVTGMLPFLGQEKRLDLGPGETRTYSSFTFTIPALTSDLTGSIAGRLRTLAGTPLASASLPINLKFAATTITGVISVEPIPDLILSPVNPFLVSPASGAILGNSVTFTWNRGNIVLARLALVVGLDPGSAISGGNFEFPVTNAAVVEISSVVNLASISSGVPVWASLLWQEVANGPWSQKDYAYTKA